MIALVVVAPLNLLVRHRPENIGLGPDGVLHNAGAGGGRTQSNIVDLHWASIEWTLGRAMRARQFWWISLAFFCALFAWYAVQVHQTKYLTEIGFARPRRHGRSAR